MRELDNVIMEGGQRPPFLLPQRARPNIQEALISSAGGGVREADGGGCISNNIFICSVGFRPLPQPLEASRGGENSPMQRFIGSLALISSAGGGVREADGGGCI